ncbi:hypothetical protein [Pseudoalteromonas sp. T1lg48]|uniref:hypothetical protein n=1 Tax=Pseudoalteromonas sp. T1lg48 TaxID=2077100 RepID=UPI000CF6A571|nr:hypothetical protein [Pseudoalteromonas sp. T1lg48]
MVDEKSLAIFMGAFVVWGFLMAMLFNLMLLGLKAKKDLRLVWVSIVMFISYFISDSFHDFFRTADVVITWFYYDVVTLMLIIPVIFLSKSKAPPGVLYVVLGLSFNSALFLLLHYDLVVVGNKERWWFWSFYSIGINVSDFLMIVALIVDRDILGLITIKSYVKRQVTTQKSSFLNKFTQSCQVQQS